MFVICALWWRWLVARAIDYTTKLLSDSPKSVFQVYTPHFSRFLLWLFIINSYWLSFFHFGNTPTVDHNTMKVRISNAVTFIIKMTNKRHQKNLLELDTLQVEMNTPFMTVSAASKDYLERIIRVPDPLLVKQSSSTSPYYAKKKKTKKGCSIS